ncbi:DedA family protein [Phycicoccus flavus]|uniref:DedA family protein n=1 Tax=Phycicoccus flavus TaxID=2502783 RepID=UPI000FEB97F2|nr:VTT domain-containing protein [Phycicoccus flavus]NHA68200.1 hypothetical protein [Phycicoccus flavus]
MRDLLDEWPVWAVFGTLWVAATGRGLLLYSLGRGVRAGGARSRLAHHLDRPLVARAERLVRRVGPPAVTLGYLTVGLQSAINASAGLLRMPPRRFLPAVVLGGALWAVVYTTVGFAVVDAVLGRVPWWTVAAAVALLAVVAVLTTRLRAGVAADVATTTEADPG